MIKSIMRNLIIGITAGGLLFVLAIILMDLTGSDMMRQDFFDNFTIYAISFIGISTGFSVSSIVFEIDRLALSLKIAINAFFGFGIFFFVGPRVGIISLDSPAQIGVYIVTAIVIFLAGSLIDYLLSDREAKRINARLREREAGESKDE